jgi:hypothetical protein
MRLNLLWTGWRQRVEVGGSTGRLHERAGPLYLGFLFLRHERGDLGMAERLKLAGQWSDVTECEIDCEAFDLPLNETDDGGPMIPSHRPLADRVNDVFAPFAQVARQHLTLLPPGAYFRSARPVVPTLAGQGVEV